MATEGKAERRMLVIDDEHVVLESCKRVFSHENYEVVTTDNARAGLELVLQTKFDVILCDWKMPEFNGMDVVEEMDNRTPESTVVMISGFPSIERATEAMKRGAMEYIAKPFTPEEIINTVNRAVKRKLEVEQKTLGKVKHLLGSWSFPVASIEDKPPRTIAETVAQKVGVGKTTSPWLSVFVLPLF